MTHEKPSKTVDLVQSSYIRTSIIIVIKRNDLYFWVEVHAEDDKAV